MRKKKCNKELYGNFLDKTVIRYSSSALAEVSPIELSHDAVSRWLKDEHYKPNEIWKKTKKEILNSKGCLIGDDSVIDKHRSKKIDLVRWQYSGNKHDVIPGIGMLNLVWHREDGEYWPVDFRIYSPPEDGKTKNDHFRELLKLAKQRGVEPEAVIADSWYSSLDNLKAIRDYGWKFVVGLRKNRSVNRKEKLENLNIPKQGLKVHLRGYGWIYVFKFVAKNGRIEYIGTNIENPKKKQILGYVKRRWNIEVYHRELKQACGLENCQARSGRAQRNHILLSVLTWIRKSKFRHSNSVSFYQQQWNLVKPLISLHLKISFA